MKTPRGACLLLFLTLLLQNCDLAGRADFESPQVFFSTVNRLDIEVAYEPGAEPFTGTTTPTSGVMFWDVLDKNLQAIFGGRNRQIRIEVPKELSQMTPLPPQNQLTWTPQEILALAANNRSRTSDENHAHFIVLFVRGYLDRNGQPDPNVLGVSLGGTTVVVLFKEVVSSTSLSPNGPIPKYVEQSTLVHEMGHALGLVNNGIPMIGHHQDRANGKHCTNTECVMYYQNEGKNALAHFVDRFINGADLVMFKDECLRDARSYEP